MCRTKKFKYGFLKHVVKELALSYQAAHTFLLVCVKVYVWVLDKTEKALLSQCITGAVTTLNLLSMLKHSN